MLTPEAKVKAMVKRVLDRYGAYHFSPAANGYGRAGIPDIIICFHGRFIAFECKAGKGKTTLLQERELAAIDANGGITLIVRDTTPISDIEDLLIGVLKETAHD